jgi:hypothetical protein
VTGSLDPATGSLGSVGGVRDNACMPYLDDDGTPLRTIRLTQAPADGRFFQLDRRIGFQEHDGGDIVWAPAHIPSVDPQPGNRTDLASVPWVFWSFIGSFGRQSAPALVHDHRCELALALPRAAALAQRFEDDRVFRVGLRQQRVPLLRSWLMWAFVSVERYFRHASMRFTLLVLQSALGVLAIIAAVVLGIVVSPLWVALALAPAAVSPLWGREAKLLVWLAYAGALLTPLIVPQLLAVGIFRLIELLVRETIDRPFVDPHPGPVITPFRLDP